MTMTTQRSPDNHTKVTWQPHKGHLIFICHSLYPKEWLKGIVAGTRCKYCLLYPFRFLLVHDYVLWLFHCPFHFVRLLQACAHAPMPPIHSLVPCSLYSKCVCQSCINIGPCPLVCSPVSLSYKSFAGYIYAPINSLLSQQELQHWLCLSRHLLTLLPTFSWLQLSMGPSHLTRQLHPRSHSTSPQNVSPTFRCIFLTWLRLYPSTRKHRPHVASLGLSCFDT